MGLADPPIDIRDFVFRFVFLRSIRKLICRFIKFESIISASDIDSSKFATPAVDGHVINQTCGRDSMPIPTGARIERKDYAIPKSKTSPHLNLSTSIHRREIFGYIAHIRRIRKFAECRFPIFAHFRNEIASVAPRF